ncbi:hypothetical protein AFLA_011514 [Aspergillus flavus NRRL3357]|nr:hypothetical protein AFLA_011514 [Aspergillus flavus NRRL3357]
MYESHSDHHQCCITAQHQVKVSDQHLDRDTAGTSRWLRSDAFSLTQAPCRGKVTRVSFLPEELRIIPCKLNSPCCIPTSHAKTPAGVRGYGLINRNRERRATR